MGTRPARVPAPLLLLAVFVFVGGVTLVPALAEPIRVETLRPESGESQAHPLANALAGMEEGEGETPAGSPGPKVSRRWFLGRGLSATVGAAVPSPTTTVQPDLSAVSNAATQARDQWRAAARELAKAVTEVEPVMSEDPETAAAAAIHGSLTSGQSPALLAEEWNLPRVAETSAALKPYRQSLAASPTLKTLADETVQAEHTFRTMASRWVTLQQRLIQMKQQTQSSDAGRIAANAQDMTQLLGSALEDPQQMTACLLKASARHRLMKEGILRPDQLLDHPSDIGPLETADQQQAFVRTLMRPHVQQYVEMSRASQSVVFEQSVPPLANDPLALDRAMDQLVEMVPLTAPGVNPAWLLDRDKIVERLAESRWTELWQGWRTQQLAELASRGITGQPAEEVLTYAVTEGTMKGARASQAYERGLRSYLETALDRARLDPGGRDVLETRLAYMAPQEIEQQVLPDPARWIRGQRRAIAADRAKVPSSRRPSRASRASRGDAPMPDIALSPWSAETMAPLKAAWGRWPNREFGARLVPWTPDHGAPHPAVLTVYAPEPWWGELRAALPAGAVELASPEALVSGAQGIMVMDAEADPAALPTDRPVVLRLATPDDLWRPDDPAHETLTPEVLLDRLWYLATQPALRGEVMLWVPESAQPVEWNNRQCLTLAVEA